jgi:hypothetical protein
VKPRRTPGAVWSIAARRMSLWKVRSDAGMDEGRADRGHKQRRRLRTAAQLVSGLAVRVERGQGALVQRNLPTRANFAFPGRQLGRRPRRGSRG